MDVFDSLVNAISGSPWTYAILLGIAALDAIFPLVPSETAVITGGVLAAAGDLSLVLVIVCAAAGACSGDNGTYVVGRTLGEPVQRRFLDGEKAQRRIDWARDSLRERGGTLIVVARFIPGGRTATTFTAGFVEYRWLRFLSFTAIAGIVWASYAALVGYVGGSAFENDPWKALLVAFGIAGAITLLVEVVRRVRGPHGAGA